MTSSPKFDRRSFLASSVGVSIALAGSQLLAPGSAHAADAVPPLRVPNEGTYVVTLGTAAGPAVRSARRGISTAIVVDGHLYVVDLGLGVVRQVVEAGLPVSELRAVLLTHLHSDHIAELPAFLLYNWGSAVNGFTRPFDIIGPGSAGGLPRGARPVVAPATPGTSALVRNVLDAYAYDVNIRVFDEARPALHDLVRPRDIQLPPSAARQSGPRRTMAPPMLPFPIYQDERVRILATLVDHPPVFPSYGFRFETRHGVVALSGDTSEHQNVVELARGADLLVHEAVYLDFYRKGGNYTEEFIHHLEQSHTDPAGTGRIATAAGARHLVLSHLAGVASDAQWSSAASSAYTGPVTVASDGQAFAVQGAPAGS